MIHDDKYQFVRFALVGAGVAGLYVALYLGFRAVMAQPIANMAAFGIAVAVQYAGQTMFTFRRAWAVPDQIGRFAAMIGVGMVVSALLTGWIGPQMNWPDWMSAAIVTVVLPVQNYLFLKFWVYSNREATA